MDTLYQTPEILREDATGQAALIASGAIEPAELLEASINQIERLNPQLNAVITPMYDKARAQINGNGLPAGPFHGVPLLLKDFYLQTADDPYFASMKLLHKLNWHSKEDTYLATKFREAGFVFIGKTNLPELAGSVLTEPELFGPTHNPWRLGMSPAGSSGGSAAAVASRMVAVAHANDGLGSIRIPAGACGLVGLKPSRGRVSVGPGRPAGLLENIVEFVLTRSLRDAAAILDAVAGPMPGDRYAAPPPARPFQSELTRATKPLRVGLMVEHPFFPIDIDADVRQAVEKTGKLLEAQGHQVSYSYPDMFHGSNGLGSALSMVNASGAAATLDAWSDRVGRPVTADDVEAGLWAAAERGRTYSAVDIHQAVARLVSGAAGVLNWWDEDGYDLLVSPLMACKSFPIGETKFERIRDAFGIFAMPYSITGQPALSLPMHWSADGMPVGVQLISQLYREDLLLRVAAELEASNPWAHHWPTPIE